MQAVLEIIPTDLIRVARAARLIGAHPSTVGRWARTGVVRSWRRGGLKLVSAAEVRAQLRPCAVVEAVEVPRTRAQEVEAADAATRQLAASGWGRKRRS